MEEMADVQLCLDNLKILMGINAKEVKMERILKMLRVGPSKE